MGEEQGKTHHFFLSSKSLETGCHTCLQDFPWLEITCYIAGKNHHITGYHRQWKLLRYTIIKVRCHAGNWNTIAVCIGPEKQYTNRKGQYWFRVWIDCLSGDIYTQSPTNYSQRRNERLHLKMTYYYCRMHCIYQGSWNITGACPVLSHMLGKGANGPDPPHYHHKNVSKAWRSQEGHNTQHTERQTGIKHCQQFFCKKICTCPVQASKKAPGIIISRSETKALQHHRTTD